MEWICVKCSAHNRRVVSKKCAQCGHEYGVPYQAPQAEKPPEPREERDWERDHAQTLMGLEMIWEKLLMIEADVKQLGRDMDDTPPTKKKGRPKKEAEE